MSNWKKFVFATDIHGDHQDVSANKAFFKFVDEFKPNIRICGGDLMDIASYRKGASDEEKRQTLRYDVEACREWLLKFKPHHFLRGNHDERLWRKAEENSGPSSDYAKGCVELITNECRKLKCQIYPYTVKEGMVRIGNLKCLHGFASGMGSATKMAHAYGSCLFGHGHGIMMASVAGYEERTARMVGCLCKLDLKYAETNLATLLWRHGWSYGMVNTITGNYEAFQAQEIGGKFVTLTGMREL